MTETTTNGPGTQADRLMVIIGHHTSNPRNSHFYIEFLERVAFLNKKQHSYEPAPDGSAVTTESSVRLLPPINGAFDYLVNGEASIGIRSVCVGVDYLAADIKDAYRHRLGIYLSTIVDLIRRTTARELYLIYNSKGWSDDDIAVIEATFPDIDMATSQDSLKDILYRLENERS
jgi:hypothetical protein